MKFLEAPEDAGHLKVTNLQNPDLVPLRPERRNWNQWGFFCYWVMHTVPLSSYTSASTLLNYGLNVKYTMVAVLVGNIITTIQSVLCGQPGGDHHLSYTIYSKAYFGSYGFYLATIIRSVSCIVWYASQAWLGGLMVNCMIDCLSYRYLTWENTLPDSVPFTNREIIGYILFQILLIPFLFYKPEHVRIPMAICSVITIASMIGICAFSVTDNNGSRGEMMVTDSSLSGSAFSWAFFRAISQWYGSSCSGVINKPDFSRFGSTKYVFIPGTVIGVMFIGTVVPLLGVISASATASKYGTAIWKPSELIDTWLLEYWNPKCRAGCFFAAFSFTFLQIVYDGVCNLWSFGMDFAAIAPRYINMRRGAVFVAIVSWVIQPWVMYNTSSNFGTVMTGFSVFFSPIIAILICDYFVVRKRKVKLTDFYTNSPDGIYYGWKGINIPGFLAFFIGMAPGLPGLINAANPKIIISIGITRYYYGNVIFSWFVSAFLYWSLSLFFKPKGLGEMDEADYYGTYSDADCKYWNVIPQRNVPPEELSKYVNLDSLNGPGEVEMYKTNTDSYKSGIPPSTSTVESDSKSPTTKEKEASVQVHELEA